MDWIAAKDLLEGNPAAKVSSVLSSVTTGTSYLQKVDVVAPSGNTVSRIRKITPAEGENPEVVEMFRRSLCNHSDWTDVS